MPSRKLKKGVALGDAFAAFEVVVVREVEEEEEDGEGGDAGNVDPGGAKVCVLAEGFVAVDEGACSGCGEPLDEVLLFALEVVEVVVEEVVEVKAPSPLSGNTDAWPGSGCDGDDDEGASAAGGDGGDDSGSTFRRPCCHSLTSTLPSGWMVFPDPWRLPNLNSPSNVTPCASVIFGK